MRSRQNCLPAAAFAWWYLGTPPCRTFSSSPRTSSVLLMTGAILLEAPRGPAFLCHRRRHGRERRVLLAVALGSVGGLLAAGRHRRLRRTAPEPREPTPLRMEPGRRRSWTSATHSAGRARRRWSVAARPTRPSSPTWTAGRAPVRRPVALDGHLSRRISVDRDAADFTLAVFEDGTASRCRGASRACRELPRSSSRRCGLGHSRAASGSGPASGPATSPAAKTVSESTARVPSTAATGVRCGLVTHRLRAEVASRLDLQLSRSCQAVTRPGKPGDRARDEPRWFPRSAVQEERCAVANRAPHLASERACGVATSPASRVSDGAGSRSLANLGEPGRAGADTRNDRDLGRRSVCTSGTYRGAGCPLAREPDLAQVSAVCAPGWRGGSGAARYFPRQTGLRFSTKAASPSLRSSLVSTTS